MGKVDMMRSGLSLMTHLEPILNEIIQIEGNQKHGKQEIINVNDKFVVVYREYFETEDDAIHFKYFCDRVYAMAKGQLPPINSMVLLFKSILPILKPEKMQGIQTHGKPDIKKTNDGKFCVILKEVFTEKPDAEYNLKEAKKLQSLHGD